MNPEAVTLLARIIDEHRWDTSASTYNEDACSCGQRFVSPGVRAWRTHRAAMILERLERYEYVYRRASDRDQGGKEVTTYEEAVSRAREIGEAHGRAAAKAYEEAFTEAFRKALMPFTA